MVTCPSGAKIAPVCLILTAAILVAGDYLG